MSNDIHNLGTRRAKHKLILPMVSTSMAKNAFRFSAARNWSELPKDIKETQSISTFSLKLKTYLSWGVWLGGGGYKCQLSVKILAICQLSVKFSAFRQLSVK